MGNKIIFTGKWDIVSFHEKDVYGKWVMREEYTPGSNTWHFMPSGDGIGDSDCGYMVEFHKGRNTGFTFGWCPDETILYLTAFGSEDDGIDLRYRVLNLSDGRYALYPLEDIGTRQDDYLYKIIASPSIYYRSNAGSTRKILRLVRNDII